VNLKSLTAPWFKGILPATVSMLIAKVPLFIAAFFLVETCLDTITAVCLGGAIAQSSNVLVVDNSRRLSYRLKQIGTRSRSRRRA
jgi:hypothetical protein